MTPKSDTSLLDHGSLVAIAPGCQLEAVRMTWEDKAKQFRRSALLGAGGYIHRVFEDGEIGTIVEGVTCSDNTEWSVLQIIVGDPDAGEDIEQYEVRVLAKHVVWPYELDDEPVGSDASSALRSS